MANEEQLAILRRGVESWNQWRDDHPDLKVDLRGADLSRTNLNGIDFRDARLTRVDLRGASLQDARLARANLSRATLIGTDLQRASLKETRLTETIVMDADLQDSDFSGAYLHRTVLANSHLRGAYLYSAFFSDVHLSKTRLTNAAFAYASLGACDLSTVIDLEHGNHHGPSTIGMDTIYKSKGNIPEVFLRGCGLSDVDIEFAKLANPALSNEQVNKLLYQIYELRANRAVQISPLFISYSHTDTAFVDQLEAHLNQKGIRFWRDVHEATAGRLEKVVDRAMRLNPTVLLILSEHSLKSDWVEHEVRTARDLEKEMGRDVLCPIALDDSWKNSPWPRRLMEQVMEYNILDFSAWRDDIKFASIFNKLINGLELFYKSPKTSD